MNTQANYTPEWIDAREAKRIFSLGKTTLYHLAAIGKIKTASLREPGNQRGIEPAKANGAFHSFSWLCNPCSFNVSER